MSVAYNHAGPWTVDAVLALPEDTTQRVELVGGQLMMSPAPGLAHRRASHRLHDLLEAAAEEAGADVEVFEGINVVVPDGLLIPDLAVVDAAAAEEATVALSAHDVLVVIEIASPSTRITDRPLKPSLYEAAAIEHYWRIELAPAPRLLPARLENGAYVDQAPLLAGVVSRIEEPFPLAFDPASLVRGQEAVRMPGDQ
ncbi:Uma2 family endonuclease [Streptomyces fuscigenes]|uniref:Uma2 family endonuclease n=1 Tax=Streptomyces fuscigenes TaxID=1528880 RepID=UPI001F3C1680|nr:Uma2 family endonuclease [Streptomyces fuscigenes]MCF3962411.1 Uma2 family endonuclease [Streptomyces fuscigenes]